MYGPQLGELAFGQVSCSSVLSLFRDVLLLEKSQEREGSTKKKKQTENKLLVKNMYSLNKTKNVFVWLLIY